MNRISKSFIAALAFGSALSGAGTASAQAWGGGGNWHQPLDQAEINRRVVASTCSGQRAFLLERRLRQEVNRGQISRWTARRIQNAIDHLQDEERHECRERDFYAAREIGQDYIRIRAWIDQESFRRQSRYGGGYWWR